MKKCSGRFDLKRDDLCYLLIDRDSWEPKEIAQIAKCCEQCGFYLILSNPSFELWFLLHGRDVSLLTDSEKGKILRNQRQSKDRKYIETLIVKEFGKYVKKSPNNKQFFDIENIEFAIQNAKNLDLFPQHRWPEYLATRVYIPVEVITTNTACNGAKTR